MQHPDPLQPAHTTPRPHSYNTSLLLSPLILFSFLFLPHNSSSSSYSTLSCVPFLLVVRVSRVEHHNKAGNLTRLMLRAVPVFLCFSSFTSSLLHPSSSSSPSSQYLIILRLPLSPASSHKRGMLGRVSRYQCRGKASGVPGDRCGS